MPETRNIDTTRREREAMVLSDAEILQLGRWAVAVEKHYGHPMDMEWAKDGDSSELFLVQARPETVQSARSATSFKSYSLDKKGQIDRDRRRDRRGYCQRQCLLDPQRKGHRSIPRGLDPGDRIHRPGLGADHEEALPASSPIMEAPPSMRPSSAESSAARDRRDHARHEVDQGQADDHASCAEGEQGFVYGEICI